MRALVLLMLVLCATARAAPSNARVVLADPDPELLRAVASALSPWHLEVIVQGEPPPDLIAAGVAGRVTRGLTTDLGARATGAVVVRPWRQRGWRFGLAADAGTTTTIQNAGLKGTWSDWSVLGLASWTIATRGWDLEPHVAAGVLRSSFAGVESGMLRGDKVTLAALRGGLWVRRRFGEHWSVGGAFDVDAVLGTPAYPKLVGNGEVFAVPDVALALGLFVAADVGL